MKHFQITLESTTSLSLKLKHKDFKKIKLIYCQSDKCTQCSAILWEKCIRVYEI